MQSSDRVVSEEAVCDGNLRLVAIDSAGIATRGLSDIINERSATQTRVAKLTRYRVLSEARVLDRDTGIRRGVDCRAIHWYSQSRAIKHPTDQFEVKIAGRDAVWIEWAQRTPTVAAIVTELRVADHERADGAHRDGA